MERRGRPARRGLLLAAGVLLALAGCGGPGPATEESQALQDTRSAVRSTALAVDLLGSGRSTRSVAVVTADDMAGEIGRAHQRLAGARARTPAQQRGRDATLRIVGDALVAVRDTEEAVRTGADLGPVPARLAAVDRRASSALRVVGDR